MPLSSVLWRDQFCFLFVYGVCTCLSGCMQVCVCRYAGVHVQVCVHGCVGTGVHVHLEAKVNVKCLLPSLSTLVSESRFLSASGAH